MEDWKQCFEPKDDRIDLTPRLTFEKWLGEMRYYPSVTGVEVKQVGLRYVEYTISWIGEERPTFIPPTELSRHLTVDSVVEVKREPVIYRSAFSDIEHRVPGRIVKGGTTKYILHIDV